MTRRVRLTIAARRVSVVLLALATECSVGAVLARAETVAGEGIVQSDEKVGIKSPDVGAIRRLPVREGDVRKKGDLLFEIENDVPRAAAETAVAEVRRAQAAVKEAEVALESTTREYERNALIPDLITDKDLALSRDAMLSARAGLKTRQEELLKAEKQLDVAQENLKQTRVLAPFDGVVTRVYLREGDSPKPSEVTVLDFLSLEKLYVEVALPLSYFRRVRNRMPARVEIEGDDAAIRASTAGTVSYVYPEADPVTRMFRVKVAVPSNGGRVQPGLFAKVRIDVPRSGR
ncbi:MAG TPA: efflux RND transporter periplasmic adaptor subunit [Methylomirabilota bacterium]|jgi:RND family efflux transporter MFP subunit|nr:efflux RND transporter periplasmic adaptor subunit [Methylomirabilota bacterium]